MMLFELDVQTSWKLWRLQRGQLLYPFIFWSRKPRASLTPRLLEGTSRSVANDGKVAVPLNCTPRPQPSL